MYTVGMASDSKCSSSKETLTFTPMELASDAALAVKFSEDAFVCSFGTAERFWAEAGRDGRKWVTRLGEKLKQDPRNAVNAWLEGSVAGQVVLGTSDVEPNAGHVNLYYLIPRCRGRGLGLQLDSYAVDVLREQGFRRATLNVSPNNVPAVRCYLRCGWLSRGPRPDAPYVDTMGRAL